VEHGNGPSLPGGRWSASYCTRLSSGFSISARHRDPLTVLGVRGSCTCLYCAEQALTCVFSAVFDLRSGDPLTIRQVRADLTIGQVRSP
jgi:hypothetical protein